MGETARTFEIEIDEEKCAGCLMCQMRCSYRFTKTFNPSRSAIEILRQPEGKREFRIELLETCDGCGLIPAHAGETAAPLYPSARARADPRARGGNPKVKHS